MPHRFRVLFHPSRSGRGGRLLLAVGAAVALGVAGAGPASAHIHVIPDQTASGTFPQLTFRVPNESPTARTVKVVVTLPASKPLTSVSTTPVPGWTAAVASAPLPKPVTVEGTTLTKAPRTVTWTAARGGGIGQDQYQQFSISAGPLPAMGELDLPTDQYYSDGTVVRWNQPAVDGNPEPEHPVPSFVVTKGNGTDEGPPAAAAADPAPASDAVARWLSGGALVIALAGLALALASRSRRIGEVR